MRLRNLIPISAKLVLFKTAILPYLTYCQFVWHFCKASDSPKIERLQERGLRASQLSNKDQLRGPQASQLILINHLIIILMVQLSNKDYYSIEPTHNYSRGLSSQH